MKSKVAVLGICSLILLTSCQFMYPDTMVLLDEKVVQIDLAISRGVDDFNDEEIFKTITTPPDIDVFEQAITTAKKTSKQINIDPDYDLAVIYDSLNGELPAHAIHLWLGNEGESSYFKYINDDELYLTTSKMTKKIKQMIQ